MTLRAPIVVLASLVAVIGCRKEPTDPVGTDTDDTDDTDTDSDTGTPGVAYLRVVNGLAGTATLDVEIDGRLMANDLEAGWLAPVPIDMGMVYGFELDAPGTSTVTLTASTEPGVPYTLDLDVTNGDVVHVWAYGGGAQPLQTVVTRPPTDLSPGEMAIGLTNATVNLGEVDAWLKLGNSAEQRIGTAIAPGESTVDRGPATGDFARFAGISTVGAPGSAARFDASDVLINHLPDHLWVDAGIVGDAQGVESLRAVMLTWDGSSIRGAEVEVDYLLASPALVAAAGGMVTAELCADLGPCQATTMGLYGQTWLSLSEIGPRGTLTLRDAGGDVLSETDHVVSLLARRTMLASIDVAGQHQLTTIEQLDDRFPVSGDTAVRFTHLGDGVGPVDIALVDGTPLVTGLVEGGVTERIELAGVDHRVRVTAAGSSFDWDLRDLAGDGLDVFVVGGATDVDLAAAVPGQAAWRVDGGSTLGLDCSSEPCDSFGVCVEHGLSATPECLPWAAEASQCAVGQVYDDAKRTCLYGGELTGSFDVPVPGVGTGSASVTLGATTLSWDSFAGQANVDGALAASTESTLDATLTVGAWGTLYVAGEHALPGSEGFMYPTGSSSIAIETPSGTLVHVDGAPGTLTIDQAEPTSFSGSFEVDVVVPGQVVPRWTPTTTTW